MPTLRPARAVQGKRSVRSNKRHIAAREVKEGMSIMLRGRPCKVTEVQDMTYNMIIVGTDIETGTRRADQMYPDGGIELV